MGRNEYARHRGCDPKAVDKAEAAGRLPGAVVRDAEGKFVGVKWRLADELWARNTDVDQQLRGNGGVLPRGPAAPELELGAPGGEDAGDDDGDGGYRDELRRHKTEGAELDTELKRLELARRRGETLAVDDQRRVSARRYRSLRDQMLAIPDRMAWLSREDRLKLAAELKRVLHELAADARDESIAGTEERVAA